MIETNRPSLYTLLEKRFLMFPFAFKSRPDICEFYLNELDKLDSDQNSKLLVDDLLENLPTLISRVEAKIPVQEISGNVVKFRLHVNCFLLEVYHVRLLVASGNSSDDQIRVACEKAQISFKKIKPLLKFANRKFLQFVFNEIFPIIIIHIPPSLLHLLVGLDDQLTSEEIGNIWKQVSSEALKFRSIHSFHKNEQHTTCKKRLTRVSSVQKTTQKISDISTAPNFPTTNWRWAGSVVPPQHRRVHTMTASVNAMPEKQISRSEISRLIEEWGDKSEISLPLVQNEEASSLTAGQFYESEISSPPKKMPKIVVAATPDFAASVRSAVLDRKLLEFSAIKPSKASNNEMAICRPGALLWEEEEESTENKTTNVDINKVVIRETDKEKDDKTQRRRRNNTKSTNYIK